MNRRAALTEVTASVLVLAGCVSADGRSSTGDEERESPRSSEIADWEYETGVQTALGTEDEPEITVDRDTATVTVEGVATHNSSSCGYNDASTPEYDPAEGVLAVEVTAGKDNPTDEERYCGDDVGSTAYRITVRFEDDLPARIEAKQATLGLEATMEVS